MTTPSAPVTLADVLAARELLRGVVRTTPLENARWLSARVGGPAYLKCENLQRAGSFKIRGAYVRISRLSEDERARGVVTASAGNHAQGVALAAGLLDTKATVYMPQGAPLPKERATRGYGAEVRFAGRTIEEALVAAAEHAASTGAVLIHPFDHSDVVAGQGSLGLEILEQCPEVRTVLVSTGGGGLLAGTALALEAADHPVQLVGVQAASAAAYPDSLEAGRPVPLSSMATMADGIAVGLPGEVPFGIVAGRVRDPAPGQGCPVTVRTVSEESMSQALLMLLERAKMVVEPAGAASVAAVLDDPGAVEPPVVAVLSGGNIDPLLLMQVMRHGMAAAGRYLGVRVRVPDRPGALAQLLSELAATDANVLDVVHERTSAHLHLDEVDVALQLETRGPEHRSRVLEQLRAHGYPLVVVEA